VLHFVGYFGFVFLHFCAAYFAPILSFAGFISLVFSGPCVEFG